MHDNLVQPAFSQFFSNCDKINPINIEKSKGELISSRSRKYLIRQILTIRDKMSFSMNTFDNSRLTQMEQETLEPYTTSYDECQLTKFKIDRLNKILAIYLINFQICLNTHKRIQKEINSHQDNILVENLVTEIDSYVNIISDKLLFLDHYTEQCEELNAFKIFIKEFFCSNIEEVNLQKKLSTHIDINDKINHLLSRMSIDIKKDLRAKLNNVIKLQTFQVIELLNCITNLKNYDQINDLESLNKEREKYKNFVKIVDGLTSKESK